jgi:beta-N-acetylhexosaminidase
MEDLFGRIMLDIEGTSLTNDDKSILSNSQVGGIIFFSRNFESYNQIKGLISEIKSIKENIIFAVDQEGGRVQRFKNDFTLMPSLQDLSKYSDANKIDICKEVAWLNSSELLAVGIDVNFAPVLDLDDSSSSIIGNRAFSSSSEEVIKFASSYIDGMHEAGMCSIAKHFPGHGGVIEDSHISLPKDIRSLDELFSSDLKPYLELVNKIDAVMCAHILFSNIDKFIPSYSRLWIDEILKNQIGFDGIVFSDDLTMVGAGNDDFYEKAYNSILAGCDMALICNNREGARNAINHFEEMSVEQSNKILRMKKTKHIDWNDLAMSERALSVKKHIKNIRS